MRLRSDEELHDNLSRGSSLSNYKYTEIQKTFFSIGLSQHEPGRINKKLTSRFENYSETGKLGKFCALHLFHKTYFQQWKEEGHLQRN